MKLRLLPIGISLVVSLTVLFGGWFLYDSYAMESPLNEIVMESPGVKEATVEVNRSKVTVHLTLNSDANLREIYKNITTRGASIIGSRVLDIDVKNDSNTALDAWWSQALFHVAQAMETKRYGDIPTRLVEIKGTFEGLQVHTEMDDKYVYITLRDGVKSLYQLLPLHSQQIGVWPNA